jgi:lipid II:glycine glycyltransferase (peptidoglycan interpeptide bridge formation enzyme)
VRDYRSIFLDDGWAHQRYYGWCLTEDHPGLRVLQKKRLAFTRSLVLLTKGGEARLDDALRRSCGRLGLADLLIHDFDCVLPDPPVVAGLRFHRAEQRERVLNIATYVVDLKEGDETLWKNFGAKSRNSARKAESNGMRFVQDRDFKSTMDCFYRFYEPVALRHALETPDYRVLEKMQKEGNLHLVSCERSDGKISVVNILYLTGRCSLYMYGASDPEAGAGAGQFVQWKSILLLKKFGYEWYDLGGIQDPAKMDGIHQFKKSIGGTFHKLGDEFRYETPSFAIVRSYLSRVRRRAINT